MKTCPKCNSSGEFKQWETFSFWYCSTCKDEIKVVAEKKTEVEIDFEQLYFEFERSLDEEGTD